LRVLERTSARASILARQAIREHEHGEAQRVSRSLSAGLVVHRDERMDPAGHQRNALRSGVLPKNVQS
jgi:hypothetical protein